MTDLRRAAEMALEALKTFEKIFSHEHLHIYETITVPEAVKSLEKALAEPDTGIDRGAWSDVPDATKWVDELRGDEPPNSTTDVVEPEEWDHPPQRDCDCKHCKEYWSDVYGAEPVAWIGQRKDGTVELTDTEPTESVKREFNMRPLYAAPPKPDLLNQTCCECGRSGGYALYCGDCWNKVTDH